MTEGPGRSVRGRRRGGARGRRRVEEQSALRRAVTISLAAIVVFVGTLAPGIIASGSMLALVRVPLEAIVPLVVLVLLPWRAVRGVIAAVVSALSVVAILGAVADRLFVSTIGRPFDIATGWPEIVSGYGVVQNSTGALGAAGLVAALAVAVVAATVWLAVSYVGLARPLAGVRRPTLTAASAVTAAWIALAIVGVQLVPGDPVAAADVVGTAVAKTDQVRAAARDQAEFDAAVRTDAYADVPASTLLTGLKGKDVVIAFIESYGRVAVQDSAFSAGVDEVLRRGSDDLAAQGYLSRSAFLTSPTFGGVSWLAHSTLQSGVWIDSPAKYDQLTSGDRFTLAAAFGKAGWRTVSDVPSNTDPWPVASEFYGFDEQLNANDVGYRGPEFSYARVPDQYTWAAFRQQELAAPHGPVMAEIDFVSSHTPWTPLPRLVPWDRVGDGSVFTGQPEEGLSPSVVWQDPRHVQELYGQSIQYTMGALFSFLTTYPDPNLVLIVVGDHQPASVVSGTDAGHDVPVSIITQDPAVLARTDSWGWEQGMLPSPAAPVWRMDAFRDRFLAAYATPIR